MKLLKEDTVQFFELFHSLLVYVNDKYVLVGRMKGPDEVFNLPMKKLADLRKKLYDNPEIIDRFLSENPFEYGSEEKEIVGDFRNFVKGRFILIKYHKDYAVLISQDDPVKAFGVKGLFSSLEDLVGPRLPKAIETTLLPFKGQIVYDGLIFPYNVTFGNNFAKSFNSEYQKAKARYGIITSIPFDEKEIEIDDLEMLKVYMKNKYNRDVYWEEIEKLKNKNRELLIYYHQKMGKIHSRGIRKDLREIGIRKGWFGILEGTIIGSGPSKKELIQNVEQIVPEDKRDLIFTFEMRN